MPAEFPEQTAYATNTLFLIQRRPRLCWLGLFRLKLGHLWLCCTVDAAKQCPSPGQSRSVGLREKIAAVPGVQGNYFCSSVVQLWIPGQPKGTMLAREAPCNSITYAGLHAGAVTVPVCLKPTFS